MHTTILSYVRKDFWLPLCLLSAFLMADCLFSWFLFPVQSQVPSTIGFGGRITPAGYINKAWMDSHANDTLNGFQLVNGVFYIRGKKLLSRAYQGYLIDINSNDGGTPYPVVIERCVLIGGNGNQLIKLNTTNGDVTIRNCSFYAYAYNDPGPNQDNDSTRSPGRAISIDAHKNITIENCYFEQLECISITRFLGNGTAGQRITVRYNQAKNIDGRKAGMNFMGNAAKFCVLGIGSATTRWVASNLDFSWNEIITYPNQGSAGDLFNISGCAGTAASPMHIHDNYLQGSYPTPANYDPILHGQDYSGSGITTDRYTGTTSDPKNDSVAFIRIANNFFVAIHGGNVNTPYGHDITIEGNSFINARTWRNPNVADNPNDFTTTNNYTRAQTAAFGYIGNVTATRYNRKIVNNYVGLRISNTNNPQYPYAKRLDWNPASGRAGYIDSYIDTLTNTHYPNLPMTRSTEDSMHTVWQNKVNSFSYKIGPLSLPSVNVTTPSNQVLFIAPASIVLTAAVSSANGAIKKVEFYNGATKLGEDATSPYTYSWTNVGTGTYSITAKAIEVAGGTSTSALLQVDVSTKLEAENALISGGANSTANQSGYSGTGFVDRFGSSNPAPAVPAVTFTVNVSTTGNHTLVLHYANAQPAARTLSLYINGSKLRQIILPVTGAVWSSWADATETVPLVAGTNTITYQRDNPSDNGGVNLDYILQPLLSSSARMSEEKTNGEVISLLKAYPNPASHQMNVEFISKAAQHVSLTLYNLQGNRAEQLFDAPVEADKSYQIQLNTHRFTSGLYVLRLVSGPQVLYQKVIFTP